MPRLKAGTRQRCAFVRPRQIFKQNARHSTDALNCVVAYNYTSCFTPRVNVRLSATLVSMRRRVFVEWTHRLEPSSRKIVRDKLLMNYIFKRYYYRFSYTNETPRSFTSLLLIDFLFTKFARNAIRWRCSLRIAAEKTNKRITYFSFPSQASGPQLSYAIRSFYYSACHISRIYVALF